MRMPSSTSDSERAFDRRALAVFACTLLAILIPYETLVRASERRHGMHRARLAEPKTVSPRVDGFLADLAAGRRYDTIGVGTSRIQFAMRPDIVAPHFGLTQNLGIAVASSIAALEWIEELGLSPRLLIVSLSPMDLTRLSIVRGELAVKRMDHSRRQDEARTLLSPTEVTRASTHALLRGTTEARHRNLGQWYELLLEGGNVLAFLNNEDATGPVGRTVSDGYTQSVRTASAEEMQLTQRESLAAEMLAHEVEAAARLEAVVGRFRARGTRLVIVRIPTAIGIRRSEDLHSFDARARRISSACGVPYIDGLALVGGEAFASDSRNFDDAEHMNSRGAIAFSNALVGRLREMQINESRESTGTNRARP
jgi:hypothetical protein